MGVWNTATPAGSDQIASGDDKIREFKTATQESLLAQAATGVEAVFPGSAPLTAPVYRPRFKIGSTASRPSASADQGLYINTTLNTIQRCDDSTWVDIATLIPSGTKMVFYQASPPTGWTAIAQNDKALRVVTSGGTGGSAGGTTAFSSCWAATSTGAEASHTHAVSGTTDSGATTGSGTPSFTGPGVYHTHDFSVTSGAGSSHSHSVTAYAPQFVDVILATKD